MLPLLAVTVMNEASQIETPYGSRQRILSCHEQIFAGMGSLALTGVSPMKCSAERAWLLPSPAADVPVLNGCCNASC
ncbi:hypothetical protein RS9916_34637 [Synechococcus sp. RS9916]|nr:hypothetical protein RS9916_34637 [Synechococcus sp. RS9916]